MIKSSSKRWVWVALIVTLVRFSLLFPRRSSLLEPFSRSEGFFRKSSKAAHRQSTRTTPACLKFWEALSFRWDSLCKTHFCEALCNTQTLFLKDRFIWARASYE